MGTLFRIHRADDHPVVRPIRGRSSKKPRTFSYRARRKDGLAAVVRKTSRPYANSVKAASTRSSVSPTSGAPKGRGTDPVSAYHDALPDCRISCSSRPLTIALAHASGSRTAGGDSSTSIASSSSTTRSAQPATMLRAGPRDSVPCCAKATRSRAWAATSLPSPGRTSDRRRRQDAQNSSTLSSSPCHRRPRLYVTQHRIALYPRRHTAEALLKNADKPCTGQGREQLLSLCTRA